MVTTEAAKQLNELVSVFNDGIALYHCASSHSNHAALHSVFEKMVKIRQELTQELSPLIIEGGLPIDHNGTLRGKLTRGFSEIRARFSSDEERLFVNQLEHVEDRTVEKYWETIQEVGAPAIKALLNQNYEKLLECQDQMKSLKRSLSQKATH